MTTQTNTVTLHQTMAPPAIRALRLIPRAPKARSRAAHPPIARRPSPSAAVACTPVDALARTPAATPLPCLTHPLAPPTPQRIASTLPTSPASHANPRQPAACFSSAAPSTPHLISFAATPHLCPTHILPLGCNPPVTPLKVRQTR